MRRDWLFLLLAAVACDSERTAEAPGGGPPLFVDRTSRSGLAEVRHYAGFTPDRYLPETMGGGVALLDSDDDGVLDLYLVNSAPLAGSAPSDPPPTNRMFRGLGSLRYEETTAESGTGDLGFGMGAAVGDVDDDGRSDLYVTNWGPNVLLVRSAPGRFEDRSGASGTADERWSVSAGFFDADGDGDLDLFVANYVVFSEALQRSLFTQPDEQLGAAYPNPDKFDGAHDRLYSNDGRGGFTDASAASGITRVLPGKGLGVAFSDFDLDGDFDVYVANDSTPNFLFENDGAGKFTDVAVRAGCAFNRDGISEASMGVDVADVDEDGRADVFVTHLELETNTLYVQSGTSPGLQFRDRTHSSGLVLPSLAMTGFGAVFLDVDADGLLDLFVANGGLHDNITSYYPDREYAQRDTLLRGLGAGRFEDVSARGGAYFRQAWVGRGVGSGDLDGDGDTDLVVGNSGGPLIVLENRATVSGNWLRVRLVDREHMTEGARIVLRAGERTWVREAWRARSYASGSDPDVFFGLGDLAEFDSLEVRWPSGRVDTHRQLRANARWVVVAGDPVARRLP